MKMLSEICNSQFFILLSEMYDIDSPIRSFLDLYADELGVHMLLNYNKLPTIEDLDKLYSYPYKIVYARYGHSLEKVAEALYQIYNPLHNTDVTETETNSGQDSHTYGGTDTNVVTSVHQTTNYHTSVNDSLTSGSTYDDTTLANMKPISKTEHNMESHQGVSGDSSSHLDYGKTLTMGYGRSITHTKEGNIGVMPTQQLLQLEYYARMRMTLFEAIVRACCNSLGSGVWSDDN